MAEDAGEISALLDFNADLFDAPTIARLAGHLRRLLAAGVAEPGRPVADLPLLGEGERWHRDQMYGSERRPFSDQTVVSESLMSRAGGAA
jgi:non-ribosomal peptide synthetase component F